MSGQGMPTGTPLAVAELPANLSEAAFMTTVIDAAVLLGWRCSHARPARTARGWATPTQGHVGVPDLTLARNGQCLLVELKTRSGVLTREQRAWLAALGPYGRCWRPNQWASEVLPTLRYGVDYNTNGATV